MYARHAPDRTYSRPKHQLWYFVLGFFFIFVADSVITYSFPILVERQLRSNVLMGLVLAASSVVGILCDYFFPLIFRRNQWRMFYFVGMQLLVVFAVALDLGSVWGAGVLFFLASAIWGVYYELFLFSQQDFVVSEEKKSSYSRDWGVIMAAWQAALIVGPLVSDFLIRRGWPLTPIALVFMGFATVAIVPISHLNHGHQKPERVSKIGTGKLLKELLYWKVLGKATISVLIMGFGLNMIQALYQVIGGLYGEELFNSPGLGSLLVVAFNASMVPATVVFSFLTVKSGKKMKATWFFTLSGLILTLVAPVARWPIAVLAVVVVSSFVNSFAWPLMEAVYSDLLERAGKSQLHLLGLQRFFSSLAFVFGPVIFGWAADLTSYAFTFSMGGWVLFGLGVLLWFITPRKVRIPQHELAKVERKRL